MKFLHDTIHFMQLSFISLRVWCFPPDSVRDIESEADAAGMHTALQKAGTQNTDLSSPTPTPNLEAAAAAAATSLPEDTAPYSAASEPMAEPPTSQAPRAEEDGRVPPSEEAAGMEGREGGAGVGRRTETDAAQVRQSVTDKLKELYPEEALDANWLQVCIC